MASTTHKVVPGRIEIVDMPEENTQHDKKYWLPISLFLGLATLSIIYLIRKFNSDKK